MKGTVIAIDPGNIQSAYVEWNGDKILSKEILVNEDILSLLSSKYIDRLAIEMVASYGMPVGKDVFDTTVFIGRFTQKFEDTTGKKTDFIYRKDVKMHLCGSTKAKDSNIKQALIDRFADPLHGKHGKGTKKDPGFFYGFSKDIWQAFAVAVYWYDNF